MLNYNYGSLFVICMIMLAYYTGISRGAAFVPPPESGTPPMYIAEVSENLPIGTEVIRIGLINPEGKRLYFRLKFSYYAFDYEYSSNEIVIKTNMVLDYEFLEDYLYRTFPLNAEDITPGYTLEVGVWTDPEQDENDCVTVSIDILNDPSDDDHPLNTLPEFADGDEVTINVPQGTPSGENIGSPIIATDDDNDDLTYKIYTDFLSSSFNSQFTIDSTTAQLRTVKSIDEAGSGVLFLYVVDGKGGFDLFYATINIEAPEPSQQLNTSDIDETQETQPDTTQVQTQILRLQETQERTESDSDITEENDVDSGFKTVKENNGNTQSLEEYDGENSLNPATEGSTPNDTPSEEDNLTQISKLLSPGQIGFSEIMFASGGGLHSSPQWLELYNNSTEHVNLKGWQLKIENRDANGSHRHAFITLESLTILPKKTALIVTWHGRKSDNISDERIYNFFYHHADEFEQNTHRNMVFGQVGFYLELTDPVGAVSDVAGNLDGENTTKDEIAWGLHNGFTENGLRSSMMRRYSIKENIPLNGMHKQNWVLSANLPLSVSTYWGKTSDFGNPAHRIAFPLPVELSYFIAERTNAGVSIKWTTESEVNNAGFNILRALTPNGPFRVINTKLIQGAGTTGERNIYTWADTTTKPNVEYYYQIEDVSFAGIHKTISTKRLKGMFTAKNRTMTLWSDLKIPH